MFRKGSILLRKRITNPRNGRKQTVIFPLHEDMTNPQFFEKHPEILSSKCELDFRWPEDLSFPDLVLSQLGLENK